VAGGIEAGETAPQAAVRELLEETGLAPRELYSAGTCEQFYDMRLDRICIVPAFVALVDAQAAVTLNHEHSEFRWLGLDEADGLLASPNQKELFAHVRRHFVEGPPNGQMRIELREGSSEPRG